MAAIRMRLDTTPAKVRTFFEKLGEDDRFRARLEKDPHKVLAQYGLEIPRSAFPAKFELPTHREAQKIAARLKDPFGKTATVPLGFSVFVFFLGTPRPPPPPPPTKKRAQAARGGRAKR